MSNISLIHKSTVDTTFKKSVSPPVSKLLSREACILADYQDPLAEYRNEFSLPEDLIYFDGNSLGARPKTTLDVAQRVIDHEWGVRLIRSYNEANWFDLQFRLGEKLGKIIGARPGETVITDTTTVNLFKVMGASIQIQQQIQPKRRILVVERDNFPSDLYVTEGLVRFLDQGYEMRYIDENLSLEEAIDEDTVFVALSHVNYRTGRLHDMAKISAYAKAKGAHSIWDVAHSVGVVPIDFHAAGVDFAVGCTYKYLNGGPGAAGFVWVPSQHQNQVWQPLCGWFGHARPFEMESFFTPAQGIRRYLCGAQPIVSLSLVECGLDVRLKANCQDIRKKSLMLTDLFIYLVQTRLEKYSFQLVTPLAHKERGSHVSFIHPKGYEIVQELIARGVIGDYREPGICRFGFAPLYVRFIDVWDAVEILKEIMDTKAWDRPEYQVRRSVT